MRTETMGLSAEHPQRLLFLLLAGFGVLACDEPTEPGEVALVTVTPSATSVCAVGETRQFSAVAWNASGDTIAGFSFAWSSLDEDVAEVDDDGLATLVAEGEATITATAGAVSGSATFELFDAVVEEIDPFLATPAEGHLWEVPVVILRYLPTADGVNLDVTVAPDFHTLGEISLTDLIAEIDAFDLRVKFALEQGSAFRGYNNPGAEPSLGYRVVADITVYQHIPGGEVFDHVEGYDTYSPDYHQMFECLDMRDYVDNQRVKEVWFWHTGFDASFPSFDPAIHNPADFRGTSESNMSSPTTGDISNSLRSETDLPVYGSTYVVYAQNYRRTQAQVLHNHGHQLEAILSYVNEQQDGNTDLFWRDFVGQDDAGEHITGRAGWTHMPPNTTVDFDYENPTLVLSDIEDWRPDNSGAETQVNADTWGSIDYAWPGGSGFDERIESQWHLYWWQNMPGRANNIIDFPRVMNNWWAFTGDWDGSIAAGLGLYSVLPPGDAPLPR